MRALQFKSAALFYHLSSFCLRQPSQWGQHQELLSSWHRLLSPRSLMQDSGLCRQNCSLPSAGAPQGQAASEGRTGYISTSSELDALTKGYRLVLLSLIPGKECLYRSRKSEFLNPCNCGWGRNTVLKRFLLFWRNS
uniref:Uncharacterized protein n=1 Tax=Micrurus surinamensis TaxID=129470 RepID=A0A2D4PYQ9_MICSU